MYKFCKCMKNLIDLDFKTGSLNLFVIYEMHFGVYFYL